MSEKKELIVRKVVEVSDLAIRKNGSAADEAIMAYASDVGDELALQVLSELEPEIMARIVRDHDFTKTSFLGLISRPEDVISIFEADPGTWNNLESASKDEINTLIRDVSDVVTGIILSKEDDEWRTDVFDLLLESEIAMTYVAVPLMARLHNYEYSQENDSYLLRFHYPYEGEGEIGRVWRLMRDLSPKVAKVIGSMVSGHHKVQNSFWSARVALTGLQAEKAGEKTEIAQQMFEPL